MTDKKQTYHNSAGMFNPYSHLPDDATNRVNADIDKHDFNLIKSVMPSPKGVIQEMTNMFFHAVVEEMRKKGIIYYDPTGTNEREFINIIRRRAAPWTAQQELGGNQGQPGADGSVCNAPVDTPYVPANPPSKVGGRSGRGGGKTKAKS